MMTQHDVGKNHITLKSRPALKRFVRIHKDKARGKTVLLAPEKVLAPNSVALEILELCNGERSVEDMTALLSERYDANREEIAAGILSVIENLSEKGLMDL